MHFHGHSMSQSLFLTLQNVACPRSESLSKIVGWCFNGTWTTTPLEDEAVDMGMGHNVTVSEVHIFWESYVIGFPVCYRFSSMLLFFLIGGESWYHSRFAEFADVRALGWHQQTGRLDDVPVGSPTKSRPHVATEAWKSWFISGKSLKSSPNGPTIQVSDIL